MTRAGFQPANNSNGLRVKRYLDQALGDRQQCLRIVLDEYLDGRTNRRGCEKGEEGCGSCRARRVPASMMSRPAAEEEEEEDVSGMFGLADMQLQTPMETSLSIVAPSRVLSPIASLRAGRNDVARSSAPNAQAPRRPAPAAGPPTGRLSAQEEQRYRQQEGQRMALQERRQEQVRSTGSAQARFAQRLEYWKQRCVWCQAYLGEEEVEGHS